MDKHVLSNLDTNFTAFASLDLTRITDKLVREKKWLKRDAETTCKLYRQFLFLKKKYPSEALPPSQDIDEFWHEHILDTFAYQQDCNKTFGEILHHNPFLPEKDLSRIDKDFERTQELHFNEFGEYIIATKSKYPKIIYYFLRLFEKKL